jgi:glycerophosphoryl diester phosphodiesterase
VHKQRLMTAAVVGVVATGFTALTATAPPLVGHASANEKPAEPERAVAALEPAPHAVPPAGPLLGGPAEGLSPAGTSGSAPAAPAGPAGPGAGSGPAGAAAPVPGGPLPQLHGRPLIIAHRGASAYRPEETLDSYRLAIAEGADYVEADLVMTRDGTLVARHENELSATTDVARHPEFADRRRTKVVGGVTTTGWFTEDFTLAELRTLHAESRNHPRRGASSTVPTLQEIINLVRAQHRPVGLYVELKVPAYFSSIGLPPERPLADALAHNRLTGSGARVYVESFDADSLRQMHQLAAVPEIQLLGGANPADAAVQPADLAQIRQYATGIGIDRGRLAAPGTAAALTTQAHQDGLVVHVFTFGADPEITYRGCFALGADGVFTDNPDLALTARRDSFAEPINKAE